MKINVKLLGGVAGTALFLEVVLGSAHAQAPTVEGQVVRRSAEVLIKADTDFAKLAETGGAEKAFDIYFAANAISPMADEDKAVDRAGVIARMKKIDDNGLKLTWKPSGGDLASSGDFGYTYGKWEVIKKDGGKSLGHGFYATVWKKGADGAWKAELDIGNEAPDAK